MLYRMVYLSYGFSVVFLFCDCKRTPMTTVTGRGTTATAEISEVARNFFFLEATNHPGSTRSPVRDHQHHTRAEGLRARSL